MKSFVTITGATGKVGKAVTEQLLKNGTHVRAVARRRRCVRHAPWVTSKRP